MFKGPNRKAYFCPVDPDMTRLCDASDKVALCNCMM